MTGRSASTPKGGKVVSQRLSLPRLIGGLGVMAAAALVYAAILRHPPVWDDHVFVFGQQFVRDCSNLPRVLAPASFGEVLGARGSARPLWLASVIADACLGGQMPVYRLTSLFWHAAGTGVVMALASALGAGSFAALAAGLLFAVHPVHAEAVAVITFRADLLCLAFLGTSVILYRRRLHAAALAAGAAALLSKETAVVLPVLLWLTDACFPSAAAPRRRRLAVYAAAAALVGGYLVFRAPRSGYERRGGRDWFSDVRRSVELPFSRSKGSAPYGADAALDDPPWARVYEEPAVRAFTMSGVFGEHLRLLLWPARLQGEYAPKVLDRPTAAGAAAVFAWAAIVAGAWRLRRRSPLASYGALWTAAALIPVCGLIAPRHLIAERYLYVPSAGLCLAAGTLLGAAWASRRPWARPGAAAALMLLAGLGAFRARARAADFRDDLAFYRAVEAADPGVPSAQLALALLAVDAGRDAEAAARFARAAELWPASTKVRLHFARFWLDRRRPEEAARQLDAVGEPRDGESLLALQLGRGYWAAGRTRRARALLEKAARDPNLWQARETLGALALERGRRDEARALLQAAWIGSGGTSDTAAYHLALASGGPERRRLRAELERRNPALAARLGRPGAGVVRPGL